MRIEPYTEGSVIHVIKRGARGMKIVEDDADKRMFVRSLFLLNDAYSNRNWHRETSNLPLFNRPQHWPERKPLTNILAWVLMPNHFHLLLQEKSEGGSAKFIQRLSGSMCLCFNARHVSDGSIFQGAYKSKTVDDDSYLRYLVFYIQVKNVLELYPGGLEAALGDFDQAWNWALAYPFSSLRSYVLGENSPIICGLEGLLKEINDLAVSKEEAREMLSVIVNKSTILQKENDLRFQKLIFE
jgi:putative transposase